MTAHTPVCPVAAMGAPDKSLVCSSVPSRGYAHQEEKRCSPISSTRSAAAPGIGRWDSFVETTIREIREKVGTGRVLCARSGGVDSSVAAVMMSKAVGKQLTCVFVDHGLLRKNEGDEVEAVFGPMAPTI